MSWTFAPPTPFTPVESQSAVQPTNSRIKEPVIQTPQTDKDFKSKIFTVQPYPLEILHRAMPLLIEKFAEPRRHHGKPPSSMHSPVYHFDLALIK
jgi:hypothetical protein